MTWPKNAAPAKLAYMDAAHLALDKNSAGQTERRVFAIIRDHFDRFGYCKLTNPELARRASFGTRSRPNEKKAQAAVKWMADAHIVCRAWWKPDPQKDFKYRVIFPDLRLVNPVAPDPADHQSLRTMALAAHRIRQAIESAPDRDTLARLMGIYLNGVLGGGLQAFEKAGLHAPNVVEYQLVDPDD